MAARRPDTDVAALLAAVAGIGPFFAVATGPQAGEWVALRDLTARPDVLDRHIASVRAALRTDTRVAASTAFQALAAQVVAPLFAAVVVEGALPAPAVRDALWWCPGGAGPWLWWPGAVGAAVRSADAAALGALLTDLLAPLVAAVRARVPVSERVLWGNAASAVASARQLLAAARPASADRATAVAAHLLTAPPLAATASLRAPRPPDRGFTFRRRSCCLYYRAPGGGLCADCVLHDRP